MHPGLRSPRAGPRRPASVLARPFEQAEERLRSSRVDGPPKHAEHMGTDQASGGKKRRQAEEEEAAEATRAAPVDEAAGTGIGEPTGFGWGSAGAT